MKTVEIPLGAKKAIYVDATKWQPEEVRRCLSEIKKAWRRPDDKTIDAIVDECLKRQAAYTYPAEVATHRSPPRRVARPDPSSTATPSTPERQTIWTRIRAKIQRVAYALVNFFDLE